MNLQLYEQQSTVNPNMPIRFIQYFSKQLEKLLLHRNLYGKKQITLPVPQFFVFYNGTEEQPECRVMKLSDSYIQREETYSLDLIVKQYNINPGYNEELKKKCPTLLEYMEYVERVRDYQKTLSLTESVERAVEECIQEGILREFLLENRAEIMSISIFEYDEEEHKRFIYEEGYEDGVEKGIEQGIEQGRQEGRQEGIGNIVRKLKNKGMEVKEICEIIEISEEEVEKIL